MSTIATEYGKGGTAFIRDVLGFKDFTLGGARPKNTESTDPEVINMNKLTPTSEQVDNTPPQKMGDIVDKVHSGVQAVLDKVEKKTDIGVNTDDLILQNSIRDLKRAHTFFATLSGQIKFAATKMSALNEQIKQVSEER